MIVAATDEAMAAVVTEYLKELKVAKAAFEAAEARARTLRDQMDHLVATHPGGERSEPSIGEDDLSGALDLLVDQRRSQALATLSETLRQAEAERTQAQQELPALFAEYRQRCEGCIAAGLLQWRRYCVGYLWSHRRPGATAPPVAIDEMELGMNLPEILRERPTAVSEVAG